MPPERPPAAWPWTTKDLLLHKDRQHKDGHRRGFPLRYLCQKTRTDSHQHQVNDVSWSPPLVGCTGSHRVTGAVIGVFPELRSRNTSWSSYLYAASFFRAS